MTVRYSNRALLDLDKGIDFAEQWHGTAFAHKLNAEILDAVDALVLQPRSCPLIQIAGNAPYRQLTVKSLTIVLYRIEEDVIQIHEIHDARTEWKK